MNNKYLHIIKRDNLNLVYLSDSFDLLLVNNRISDMCSMFESGVDVSKILERYKDYEAELVSFKNIINISHKEQCSSRDISKEIDKITLLISNDCNLRCKYCYANGGDYKMSRHLMAEDTAKEFVDFCIENFSIVRKVMFFGGEPMLNIPVMKIVCSRFKEFYDQGIISYLPFFTMVTNGTILNTDILQFLKENIAAITVSIDGPKAIHDANRIYNNGKGSYEKVARFIRTVINETHIPVCYEATYTQEHIKQGYTKEGISYALKSLFGIDGDVVEENSIRSELKENIESLDIDKILDSDFSSLSMTFWKILHTVVYKKEACLCSKDLKKFSINTLGDIYSCHILNGMSTNCLGNIRGKNIFNDSQIHDVFSWKVDLKDNEQCNSCWCKNLCGGCPFPLFYDNQQKDFVKTPNVMICDKKKSEIEDILIFIAKCRKNPDIWKTILEKGKEKVTYA